MAAAREEGLIKLVAVNDDGASRVIMGNTDTRLLAPTGKIAEPEQWPRFSVGGPVFSGNDGWTVQIVLTSEASDTLDNANDTIVKLPFVVNGVTQHIGKKEFGMESGGDFASPAVNAGVPVTIGAWRIPSGVSVQFGGMKGWIEPYDDTA